jgi:N-acetyl-alpha-D-muramate 1-phosphate uridylyltransferase
MKAMILAAGLGTRLKPFTDFHPKALFEVNGKTLLEHAVDHLKTAGITEVIINVHHFASQVTGYLEQKNNFGIRISLSDETGGLLETGGGLKKAAWFFTGCDCAIIRNVDVLSDLDLKKMVSYHIKSGALATLAVRNRETSRYLLFDPGMQLCGWENRKTGESRMSRGSSSAKPLAFSGIQVVNPEIFPVITEVGKFSLTDLYLRLAKDQKITGYLEEGAVWEDVGKYEGKETKDEGRRTSDE